MSKAKDLLDLLEGSSYIPPKNVVPLIEKAKAIVKKIESVKSELSKISKEEQERMEKILGVGMDDPEAFEKALDQKGEELDSDPVIKELGAKRKKLFDQQEKLFGELHAILGKIYPEYKRFPLHYIYIYYDSIKKVFLK